MIDKKTPEQTRGNRSPLRVLTLDGGGILGAFTAGVARRADESGQTRRGTGGQARDKREIRLLDHVDLIAGTSTGGILAIALAMGKSPAEVCDFYRTYGPKIFPSDPLKLRALLWLVWYKYNPKPLREAIESVVGSKPLKEACCGLVIPAIDAVAGNIRLFKTDHLTDSHMGDLRRPGRRRSLGDFGRAHVLPGAHHHQPRHVRRRGPLGELPGDGRPDRGGCLPRL